MDFIPESDGFQALFCPFLHGCMIPDAMNPETVYNVVKDGQGQRVWSLRDHPNVFSQVRKVCCMIENIYPVDSNLPVGFNKLDKIYHAVHASQEG